MFYIDDIQKSIAKSEGALAKTLAFRLTNPRQSDQAVLMTENETFALLEKSQEKVFHLLLSYYVEDCGVGVSAKQEIFLQMLAKMDQQGVIEHNSVLMIDRNTQQHIREEKILHEEMTRMLNDKTLLQTMKTDKDLFKQMKHFDQEALLGILTNKIGQSYTTAKPSFDKSLFEAYIEKTLGDILDACRRYEKKLALVTKKMETGLEQEGDSHKTTTTPSKPKMS